MRVMLREEVAAPGIDFLYALIGESNMQILLAIQDERSFDTFKETISWILSLIPSRNINEMKNRPTGISAIKSEISRLEDETESLTQQEVAGLVSVEGDDKFKSLPEFENPGGPVVDFNRMSSLQAPHHSQMILTENSSLAACDKPQSLSIQPITKYKRTEESFAQTMPAASHGANATDQVEFYGDGPDGESRKYVEPEELVSGISKNQKPEEQDSYETNSSNANSVKKGSNTKSNSPPPSNKCHVCQICLMQFKTKERLQRHSKVHIQGKLHSCEVCHKQFLDNYRLQRHSRIHTGERPYICDICNFRFKQKAHLTKHFKIHGRGLIKNESTNEWKMNQSI